MVSEEVFENFYHFNPITKSKNVIFKVSEKNCPEQGPEPRSVLKNTGKYTMYRSKSSNVRSISAR